MWVHATILAESVNWGKLQTRQAICFSAARGSALNAFEVDTANSVDNAVYSQ